MADIVDPRDLEIAYLRVQLSQQKSSLFGFISSKLFRLYGKNLFLVLILILLVAIGVFLCLQGHWIVFLVSSVFVIFIIARFYKNFKTPISIFLMCYGFFGVILYCVDYIDFHQKKD